MDVHRAQWHTFEGRTGCHIAHEIPGQGVALISHRHDGSEYLSFFANRPPREEVHGELHIANPPWGVETRERVEPIRLHPHPRTIRFSQRTTQRLLEALRDGREPRIRYERAYSDDRIAIGFTPAAFQQALEQYRACINRHERVDAGTATRGAVIPGRSGEPMADSEDAVWEGRLPRLPQGPRTEVFFATGSDGLTRDALGRIEDFVRDVEDNPHWGVVLSIGYADTRGGSEINEQLARERAHAVRDQLIRLGLPGDRIEVEARLIDAESPERDLYELAENRRVELRTAL
ncbi:MAG: OmpA family protein [Halorhodospira sp.]